jgi:two-component system, OmpR family, alkaline phosphatase synthesis response regulator PhoP
MKISSQSCMVYRREESVMAKETVLVVEDDTDIRELIRYNLSREGYNVLEADSGEGALHLVQTTAPNIIILDLMLPGIDGMDVCRTLKKDSKSSGIPIIMLTAKTEDSDIVSGLELGADDYVTKPFSPKVLIARIRTILRRKSNFRDNRVTGIHFENLSIYPRKHLVTLDDTAVELTATEFDILYLLASHPGWVYSRQQIIDTIKGDDYPVTERSIDVQIVGLRKNLGDAGNYIETVRGVGYRFRE